MPSTNLIFQAGVARRTVSPPQPRLLSPTGMGRKEPTQGVLDPLYVEALAFCVGESPALLITADILSYRIDWVKEIRATVAECIGIDPWHILFSATHSHCASPRAIHETAEAVAAEEEAYRLIIDATIQSCCEAFENRRPAEMAALRTQLSTPIGENRRVRFSSGLCLNGWGAGAIFPPGQKLIGPAGPDSTEVDIWCVREPGAEQPFGVFVSYATHPHLYELPAFSGEFPGAAKRLLGEKLPGATILHANHACGDIDIHRVHPMPDDPGERIAWFQRSTSEMGACFAECVLDALPRAEYCKPTHLRFDHFSTESTLTGPDQRAFNMVGLALDDVAFVSIPGEIFHELGRQIHARSPFSHLNLMAYNGTGSGYLAPPLAFEQGSYEVMRGPFPTAPGEDSLGPVPPKRGARRDSGIRVVEEILALLHRLHP